MKILRKRLSGDNGPRFTLAIGSTTRPAKYAGEVMALVEAQREAQAATAPLSVRVMDEDVTLYTVIRDEDKTVTTYAGGRL